MSCLFFNTEDASNSEEKDSKGKGAENTYKRYFSNFREISGVPQGILLEPQVDRLEA